MVLFCDCSIVSSQKGQLNDSSRPGLERITFFKKKRLSVTLVTTLSISSSRHFLWKG